MQQRVALARALAIEPSVLLLDEPLSALDAKVRVQLREEIRRIQLELGITTIYVTHDQEEALSISDRVAVMHGGRIEQIGSPAEMYGSPATPFVAEFIGTMNRLVSTVAAGGIVEHGRHRLRVAAADGLPVGERVLLLVRPETVSVAELRDGSAPDGTFGGEVVSQIFLGAVTRVRIEDENGDSVIADLGTNEAATLSVGTKVSAVFAARGREAAQPRGAAGQRRPQQIRTIAEDPVHAERRELPHARRVVDGVDGRAEAEIRRFRHPTGRDAGVVEADTPRVLRRGPDRVP